MCLAVDRRIPLNINDDLEFKAIAEDIVEHWKAKIIIIWAFHAYVTAVIRYLRDLNAVGHFIVFGSDGWDLKDIEDKEMIAGAFKFLPAYEEFVPFQEWFQNMTLRQTTVDPWFRRFWEQKFNCSFSQQTCLQSADDKLLPVRTIFTTTTLDAVYSIAHALQNIINDRCPDVRGKEVRRCVTGPLLRDYLFNVSFFGFANMTVSFDEKGDIRGRYKIKHLRKDDGQYNEILLGYAEIATNNLFISEDRVQWAADHDDHADHSVPESVCSHPCPWRHYKIQKTLCCWECRICRDNEYLVFNGTNCISCPHLTWPDVKDASKCIKIPPTFLRWSDTVIGIIIVVVLLGVIFVVSTGVLYYRRRSAKLIKACSRELSAIILLGVLMSYLVIFAIVKRPNDVSCYVGYFGFHLSITTIYAPLLTKTNRIYRIFSAGKKSRRQPKFIRSKPQIAICSLLITVQVRNLET